MICIIIMCMHVYVITYDYSSYSDVNVSYNNQIHIAQKFGCGIFMHMNLFGN